ncbi:hypothetical protein CLV51_11024 [Chitinophaga niastensis]|uniref:Uncharacterized protein n=1 Tax=Chitinophaga niastensis TaxID=536980 RepID=A0A2P8H9A9_CHINA|nr:hypothetical protein [Chitinophaga niastensis]PSL42808.1 hypothetical protein CLV51_11024 [Chitinophaga niastensis]
MKSIIELTNAEKAGLIYSLVPEDIPGYLDYIQQTYNQLWENKARFEEQWEGGFIEFGCWLEMAECVNMSIENYGKEIRMKKTVFMRELFENNYGFLFSIHCLDQYSRTDIATFQCTALVSALFK